MSVKQPAILCSYFVANMLGKQPFFAVISRCVAEQATAG
jgi:hypothetical protein